MGISYQFIENCGLTLPEVEVSTSYGTPALKVRGKLMARLKEDLETLVVRATWEDRERLMTLYPKVFFVTDHYLGHPWVLLHLATANKILARQTISRAWQLAAPAALARKHPDIAGK